MCSCGMYWVWNEEDARRHEREEGIHQHMVKEIELSDEEWGRLKKDFKPFIRK